MKLSSNVKYFFLRVINMRTLQTSLLLFFLLQLSRSPILAQGGVIQPSKTEAEAAWNAGRYESAFDHYNGLLLLYSRDPLYKYYTGACLVQLQRDIPRAAGLLSSAISSSAGVKSIPDDVWFWYGRSLQLNGDFTQASDAYSRFVKTAGKKISQEYEVQRYIDDCSMGLGRMEHEAQGTEHGAQGTEIKDPEIIPVPEEYDAKLERAVLLQYKSDSLTRVARGVRKEMESSPPEKKEALKKNAESVEKEAAVMQSEADRIFLTLEPADGEVKAEAEAEAKVETAAVVVEEVQTAGVPVFSVFEVLRSPAYSASSPIPVGKGAPSGLVYRVQLAAFRNAVQPELFKGLYPIYGKIKPDNDVTYYYAGMFRSLEAARQVLPSVHSAGFADAFVVAMMDDIQVSMERAAMLEKEWSGKPLLIAASDIPDSINVSAADTLPVGTLSFRAEVMRSKKPVKPDVIEKIELLAGTRGMDMIKNSQGETIFLIGNFITFESAEEYVSLLVRNGYSTARVAAYVGVTEIPVEAAKELLNKLLND